MKLCDTEAKLLTPADVQKLTGMSSAHVRKLIDQGRLAAVNVGAGTIPRWAIPESVLKDFLTPKASACEAGNE